MHNCVDESLCSALLSREVGGLGDMDAAVCWVTLHKTRGGKSCIERSGKMEPRWSVRIRCNFCHVCLRSRGEVYCRSVIRRGFACQQKLTDGHD